MAMSSSWVRTAAAAGAVVFAVGCGPEAERAAGGIPDDGRGAGVSPPAAPVHAPDVEQKASIHAAYLSARMTEAADDVRYAIEPAKGAALVARSFRKGFDGRFDDRGAELSAEGQDWQGRMDVVRFGCDDSLEDVTSEAPVRDAKEANRLSYVRRAGKETFTEWWVNGEPGMEQGFTVERSPCGGSGAELTIELAVDGFVPRMRAEETEGRAVELLGEDGIAKLRYANLYAYDAAGVVLPARMVVDGGRVALRVEVSEARWPVVVDPVVATPEAKLQLDVGDANDLFGNAVSVSGDTALVGAVYDDVGANANQGSAYVFVRSGTTWIEQAHLTASDGLANDRFGNSVSVSGDTALVGASFSGITAQAQGTVYVFVRNGPGWVQQARLTASDAAGLDLFGSSVSVSGDTALVGAAGQCGSQLCAHDVGANANQGSAYVFVRSGTVWTQQGELTASDGAASDLFGNAVAVSGDTAAVGASLDDIGANVDQGSAYVFVRSGTVWTQQGKVTANGGAASDQFGNSVSVSGDTVLVGASSDDVGANVDQGSAYVFVRSGTVWAQQAKVTAGAGAASDLFGNSVSVSGDTALAGASSGWADVFVRSGTAWAQQGRLTASAGAANDWFGYSVSVSGDTALVGAYHDDIEPNADRGSAYVFVRSGTAWAKQAHLTASDGAANDWFGYSVSLSGDTALVGAYRDDVGATADQGSAYVFVRTGTGWAEQAHLTVSGLGFLGGGAGFGGAVSLNGDTAVVSAFASAYVFVRSGTSWAQQTRLMASDGMAFDGFGSSVSVSGDTVLVGAPGAGTASTLPGSAYVFVRSGTSWAEQTKLTASDAAGEDAFGSSVSASGDMALVGADQDDVGTNNDQGSAYVFVRSGTAWAEQAHLTASDARSGKYFGTSVSASGDTALVGADGDDVGTKGDQGSAYVFVRSGTVWAEQAHLTAGDGAASDYFGTSVSLSGDTALVGARQDDIGTNADQGSVYVLRLNGLAGHPCGASTDCADNYSCADGVCCTSACSGFCDVCSAGLGATADGYCTIVPAGTPGTPVCTNNVLCDGVSAACPAGCTSDAQCAVPFRCAQGTCALVKDDGEACFQSKDCFSNHCVDGVCCDDACPGECVTCLAAKNGAPSDGVCLPVTAGTDPDGECPAEVPASCGWTGVCGGSSPGACARYLAGTDCGSTPGLTTCVGNKVVGKVCTDFRQCLENPGGLDCAPQKCTSGACAPCVTEQDCYDPNASYCDGAGVCHTRKAQGVSCASNDECLSTYCVDGVCCGTACNGQCEWCGETSQPGTCVATPAGPPKGGHPACTGSPPCQGACDGAKRDGCAYPDGATECAAASCENDALVERSTCDGNGLCAPGATKDCLDYGCDATTFACRTTCASTTDCRAGATCDLATHACSAAGATCRDGFNVQASDGTVTSCDGYACVAGACQQQCAASADCATGYECSGTRCVVTAAASGGAPGVGAGGANGGGTTTPGPDGGASPNERGGTDAGDARASSKDSGGCGCRVDGKRSPGGIGPDAAWLLVAVAMLARRRTRIGASIVALNGGES